MLEKSHREEFEKKLQKSVPEGAIEKIPQTLREPQKKFRKREFQQRVPKRRAEKEPQRGIREKIQKSVPERATEKVPQKKEFQKKSSKKRARKEPQRGIREISKRVFQKEP